MWVRNAHGLIEGHTPDNLLAYDNRPQFCLTFTKKEYELLYKMLNPSVYNPEGLAVTPKGYMFSPYIAGVLYRSEFDPAKAKEAIRVLPNKAPRMEYSFVKKMQVLIQQVADKDLPLLIGIKDRNDDEKILGIILEWRLLCQKQS